MKAACLLLALTVASAAGHIFPRQYQDIQSLIVQPLDYINQAQDFYQRQKDQNSQSDEQTVWEHQRTPSQKQKHQRQGQSTQQQVYQIQHQQKGRYQLQQRLQGRQQQPLIQEQYQPQQERQQQPQSQEQYQPQHQLEGQKKKKAQRVHDSTSAESNSQEARIEQYAMPVYADVENLNTRLYRKSENQPTYGDVITWRGVQIAASPDSAVKKEDIQKIFSDAYKTMKYVSSEDKKIFHHAFEQAAQNVNEEAMLNATELLQKHLYPVETHTIKTEDGYYLTLFRIPPKDQTLVQRPVVFLMHGLLGSADDWLLMGPGKSLAYQLADAGYEVWLGNARGSKYSRRHVSKHPAQADFWQFSTDEIALQDLPSMIDYALKTTNQQKLYYVGYSLGTTAFFALAATRPEYNDKIIMMHALSPMVYMSNARSPLLRMIAPTSPLYERLHQQLGHGQFKPSTEFVYTVGGAMCETEIGCRNVCSNANFVMSGVNVENLDVEQIPVIMAHQSQGASTRQMKQYAQAVASHEFTKYDFGADINEQVYGSRQPPQYDMHKVQAPVALYYSAEDWLAHPLDVDRLAKELPNVKDSYKVPEPHFSHMDFQFSKVAPQMVYDRLIQNIQKNDAADQQNVY